MTGSWSASGRPLDEHARHVRFRVPDPVLALPDQERTPESWLSHADARTSVMMQVPGLGSFVRCLLPVHLTGGHTLIFGLGSARDVLAALP